MPNAYLIFTVGAFHFYLAAGYFYNVSGKAYRPAVGKRQAVYLGVILPDDNLFSAAARKKNGKENNKKRENYPAGPHGGSVGEKAR